MSRNYCVTLNNYTIDELGTIYKIKDIFRYIILGAEIGENGTKHLQGYFELFKPQRLSFFKKGPFKRAHLEKRKGTREEARIYCTKDNDIWESGDFGSGGQGTRNDLKSLMGMIKDNKPMIEIFEEMPKVVSKNLRFIEKYQALVEKETTKKFRQVNVEVIVGPAGIGKTKQCFERDENLFTVNSDESFPFDGYNGEKTILIDDFYGGIKYAQLLRVLDGHQYRVNVKGGHRYAKWDKVFITSNKNPNEWYNFGMTPALKRRLSIVTTMCNEEPGNTKPALLNGLDDLKLAFD